MKKQSTTGENIYTDVNTCTLWMWVWVAFMEKHYGKIKCWSEYMLWIKKISIWDLEKLWVPNILTTFKFNRGEMKDFDETGYFLLRFHAESLINWMSIHLHFWLFSKASSVLLSVSLLSMTLTFLTSAESIFQYFIYDSKLVCTINIYC